MTETMLLTLGAGLIIVGAALAGLALYILNNDRPMAAAAPGLAGVAFVLAGIYLVQAAATP